MTEPLELRQPQLPAARRVQPPGRTQLQVSWEPGRVVAWAAGRARHGDADEVAALLAAAGAPESGWTEHDAGPVAAAAAHADAVAIPVGEVLGWLVAAGAGQVGDEIGPSVRWLGAGRDLGRRAHRARRDGSVAAPAHASRQQRARLERLLLGALDARARRPDAARRLAETMPGSVLRARPQASTPGR